LVVGFADFTPSAALSSQLPLSFREPMVGVTKENEAEDWD
jgi:hypothetical protein